MINCIILDDEPLAIKVIQNFIKKTDYLNCIGTFSNAPMSMPFLKKNNVVGDINLRFINESGKNIKTNLDKRIMGIDLDLLKKVPRRIAVAGGKQKHKAIYASLKGGFINTLITDSQTAQFLIKS